MKKESIKQRDKALTDLEKQVIAAIQGDMPIVERPYRLIAEGMGIEESLLLEVLSDLVDRGIIRRFGATLRHQKSGYQANVMVAWQVAEERIDDVGRTMASFREVSHCYRRDPTDQWPYNLYTMVHGSDEQSCCDTAEKMSRKSGVRTYSLLFSRRELKKTSMQYFGLSNDEQGSAE
jgi:DNA-binding Lrp family transcriptional regulator